MGRFLVTQDAAHKGYYRTFPLYIYMCRLLVGCLLFCVDVTDGAQQCSVLQVRSGDIHGIIHRHSLLLRRVRVLVLFVLFVFTKSGVLYVHLLLHRHFYRDKNNTLVKVVL